MKLKLQYKFKLEKVENSNPDMQSLNRVNDDQPESIGFVNRSEDEKLRESIMRSPLKITVIYENALPGVFFKKS